MIVIVRIVSLLRASPVKCFKNIREMSREKSILYALDYAEQVIRRTVHLPSRITLHVPFV